MESKPHSEPCPVCLRDDAWELEYDLGTGDEVEVIRCQNCQWPPTTPHTVEEWRRRHFISPYLKDLEAMVAERDEKIGSLEEQLEAARREIELLRSAFAHEKDGQHAKAQRLYEASSPASEPKP